MLASSSFKMKGWVLGSAAGAVAVGVHMERGGWAKILPELTAAREGSWGAEGAALCEVAACLHAACRRSQPGDMAPTSESGGCCVPPNAPRASGCKTSIMNSSPAPPTLEVRGLVAHPAFPRSAFRRPAAPLAPPASLMLPPSLMQLTLMGKETTAAE